MKTNKLNLSESKKVYRAYEDLIKPKECYKNIFNLFMELDELREGKWNVAYGYMPCLDNIFVRHCYIINENGEVIDPTAMIYNKKKDGEEYLTFAILGRDEYIDILWEDEGYAALWKHFRTIEADLIDEYFQKGIILMG